MKDKLEQIKAECKKAIELREKATPGPWEIRKCPCGYKSCTDSWPGPMKGTQGSGYTPSDASFVSHSRTFSPRAAKAMLMMIEKLETKLRQSGSGFCEQCLKSICDQWEEGK